MELANFREMNYCLTGLFGMTNKRMRRTVQQRRLAPLLPGC